MPRAFDITATTTAVTLDKTGQGEVAFTVSNALRLPMRIRASVEPAGNTQRQWLSLPGGEEKELPPDGTAQFTVRLAVPAGAPPGQYTFQLLVVDLSNPDERYARGPAVAFTVAEPPPPPKKKPFPWWLVAVIGGAVLLIGFR